MRVLKNFFSIIWKSQNELEEIWKESRVLKKCFGGPIVAYVHSFLCDPTVTTRFIFIYSITRFRFKTFKSVFTGRVLCDWLVKIGLAEDRDGAVAYGRRLLLGRVITHINSEQHFHDSPHFYKFLDTFDYMQCWLLLIQSRNCSLLHRFVWQVLKSNF